VRGSTLYRRISSDEATRRQFFGGLAVGAPCQMVKMNIVDTQRTHHWPMITLVAFGAFDGLDEFISDGVSNLLGGDRAVIVIQRGLDRTCKDLSDDLRCTCGFGKVIVVGALLPDSEQYVLQCNAILFGNGVNRFNQ
jgi:hypothetical protein